MKTVSHVLILLENMILRLLLWIDGLNHQETGLFTTKDNRTEEENEIARLRKENQHLLMENDILKQVALIMGRK